MMKTVFFKSLTLSMGLFACFANMSAAQTEQPNIVLLLADDLGWTDINSDYYETPHIDRLRQQGMTFTDAYSSAANCAPSRACIITGQYVPRHGVYTVNNRHRFDRGVVGWGGRVAEGPSWDEWILLPPENAKGIGTDCETIGTAMQRAGYRTGFFGKWHVGWGGKVGIGGYAEEVRGFDEFALCSPSHWNSRIWNKKTWPNSELSVGKEQYLSDYLTDQAIVFLAENKEDPFFLFLSDFLVHLPAQAKEELIQKYKNKVSAAGHKDPVYAAMVEAYDESVGRILAKLDELGLSENTLVFFTSDNGGDGRTSNLPLRGSKEKLYEGGIRVPAVVRWPDHVEPGRTCNVPVCGIDLFPTFASVGNSPISPENYLLDGQSLAPLFEGRDEAFCDRDLFWYMPGYMHRRQAPAAIIRSGNYKLWHFFEDDHFELYNLREDIGETKNLTGQNPEITQKLKDRLRNWRKKTGATIPPRNPNPKEGVIR